MYTDYVINAHFTFFIMQCFKKQNINKNGSISDLFTEQDGF